MSLENGIRLKILKRKYQKHKNLWTILIYIGQYKDRGWRGYEIIYDDYDSDDD